MSKTSSRSVPLILRVQPLYALIFFVMFVAFWRHHEQYVYLQNTTSKISKTITDTKNTARNTISGEPIRIVIPQLSIDNNIIKGTYNSHSLVWTLSNYDAIYDSSSILPNNKTGETIIYGHIYGSIFGNLLNANRSDVAYVYTNNKHVFVYSYKSNTVVKPTNTSILYTHSKKPILVLITCDNWYATSRKVVIFNLVGYK